MLKMYHKEEHSGSTPDYWEGNWENAQFESAVRFCLIDPLRRLFEKYSKPGSLMLEGGCGMGQYLALYAAEGRPEASLTEARRVIKKDGILLISVPYFSPLRRALVPFKRKDWRKLSGPEVDKEKFAGDKTFFQY